jgi:RNA ligase (TIGR02306 family)
MEFLMIDEITAIEYVESMSLRYDIEVQDNNNFFANGILVHNCQNLGTEIFAYENQIVETNIDPAVLEADALASGRLQVIDGKVFSIREAKASPDDLYEITMKLDGSSMTAFVRGQIDENGVEQNISTVGVASRNLELKINEENKDNAFVKVANETGLLEALKAFYKSTGREIAVQGELMGPGIQGNREGFTAPRFFVFDIFDIKKQEYLGPMERIEVFELLKEIAPSINHVPVLHAKVRLKDLGITDVKGLLEHAKGPSINHKIREGEVYKRLDGQFSFKAINDIFLLGEKD